jgi:Zn-dependent metalloprotease
VVSPSPGTLVSRLSVIVALGALFYATTPTVQAFEPDDSSSQYEVDRRGAEKARHDGPTSASKLSRSPAWSAYVAKNPGWVGRWNPSLGTLERAQGPGIRMAGFDPSSERGLERSARTFLASASVPTLPSNGELSFARAASHRSGHWIHFAQEKNGIPVFNARLSLRVSPDGRVSGITNRTWPGIDVETTPRITAGLAGTIGLAGLPEAVSSGAPELMILPVEKASGAVHHLAWRTESRTADPPGHWISFVDAATGTLLWRFNNVRHSTVSGEVSGLVEPSTNDNNFIPYQLPYVEITSSALDTVTTGLDGTFNLVSAGSDPLTITATLAGPYGRIYDASDSNETPFITAVTTGDSAGLSFFFDGSTALASERDAFYHVMVAHDYVNLIEPDFHFLDYQMPIIVEIDRTCNAFWDGVGVNFFADGGGCFNTGRLATVVQHEYGHGVTDFMYRPFFPSGAMHEGFSDYFAATITDQPIIGAGFRGPGTNIRRIDVDKKYPDDVQNQVHADGLIVASALWDVRERLGREVTDELFHFARYGYSDSFDDYFMDFLSTDDDDGNIYNGTAHFTNVVNVFRAHGIGDYSIHVSHAGTPDTEDTLKVFPLTASFLSIFALEDSTVRVHVTVTRDTVSTTTSHPMTPTGGLREYSHLLAAQPAGTLVSYYFTATDTSGGTVAWPEGGAADPFLFQVGPDAQAPTIVHAPLPDQPADIPGLTLHATISDNLDQDLIARQMVYRKNGGSLTTVPLIGTAGVPDDFSGILPVAGGVIGDLFEYRLEAVDGAAVSNMRLHPPTGFHEFRLVRGFGKDFEDTDGGLTATGDWEWSAAGLLQSVSGPGLWGTGLSGNYSDLTTSLLNLPAVDLTDFTSAAFTFSHAMHSEPEYDGGVVEISTDGGSNWESLVPDGDYDTFPVIVMGVPGYSGEIAEWTPAEFDLSPHVGKPDVRLRFRFVSDENINGAGWFVDELQVVERQVLSRPLAVTAKSGNNTVVPVSWDLPGGIDEEVNNPIVGYRVYRSTSPAGPPALLTPEPLTIRNYLDQGLTNGTHYFYFVSAVYEAGESVLSGPAEAVPFRPIFSASSLEMHVMIDSVGTVDTTLTISNTGSGNLRMNVYTAQPDQEMSDVRIHIPTGGPEAPGAPPSAPRLAVDETAGLAALLESAAARLAERPRTLKSPLALTPPGGTWDTLYVDADDMSLLDLATVESQQTAELLFFRITSHEAWNDPGADFNLLLAIDVDGNQTTGFRGGEYLLVSGPIILNSFGVLSLLLDSDFTPLALPHYQLLPASASAAEFGIRKSDIGLPQSINLKVYALSPPGSVTLDQSPSVVTFPWLSMVPGHLVAMPDDPAELDLHVESAGLPDGDYTAKLLIATNDPEQLSAAIAVTLTITGGVPVVLAEFTADHGPAGTTLRWVTSSETDHAGFHVWRREVFPARSEEVQVTDRVLTSREGVYEFTDAGTAGGRDYEYRLADISRGGTVTFHGPFRVSVPGAVLPAALWLAPASPNPARGRVSIGYGVPRTGEVDLRIFSIDGRLVRTLESGTRRDAGYYAAEWDGRDDGGRTMASGVYFYRIESGGRDEARKLLWVR